MQKNSAALTRTAYIVSLVSVLFLSACSLPRIIILHDPLSAEEHDKLGRIYESQGKTDLAREQYRQALELDGKHVETLLLLGDLSYRTGEYPAAETAYEKALKLAPDNGDARNNLAWVYIKTGRKLDAARELVTRALELNPGHRPYYLDTLGVIYMKLGDGAAAVPVLKEAVDTIPRDQSDLVSEAQGHLAEADRMIAGTNAAGIAVHQQENQEKTR